MAVSTIYQNNNNKSRSGAATFLIYALIVVALLAIAYFGFGFIQNVTNLRGTSALSVDITFGNADVYINDEFLGNTPYESGEEKIKPGENKVSIKGDQTEYEITLNFAPNSEVGISRDLGISQVFSSGQNFWLERNDSESVLSIISEPTNAQVFIDDTNVGQTPYSTRDLSPGAYDLRVELEGYETQVARIEINEGYKLNASVSLFPKPVPDTTSLLEDSETLFDVYSDNLIVTSDVAQWVDAIIYWNTTRGVNLSGVGVNKESVFDYYIDYDGNLYNADGDQVSIEDADFIADAIRGAYLRKASDGEGLSQQAKDTFLALDGVSVSSGKKAEILETGLGWLRVRSEPSLNGSEVAKVNVGDTHSVLDETAGWVKIRVSEDLEGWVSDTYVSVSE